jgi:hypothetical protein
VHHSIWTKLLALLREHAHEYLFWREAEIQALLTLRLCLTTADPTIVSEWRAAGQELEQQLTTLDSVPLGALDTVHSRAEAWSSELAQGLAPLALNERVVELRNDVTRCLLCPKELKRELYAMLLRLQGSLAEQERSGDSDGVSAALKDIQEKTGKLKTAHLALCRPDGIAIGKKNRTLLMLEFTRGSDYGDDFVARIESAKTARYARVLDVMRRLLPGWQVEVVCFTVGVRGSVPRASLEPSLRRLGVDPAPAHKIMAAVAAATFEAMFTVWDTRAARLAMIRPPLPSRVAGRGSQGRPPL